MDPTINHSLFLGCSPHLITNYNSHSILADSGAMAGQACCQPENRVHNVGATLLSILYSPVYVRQAELLRRGGGAARAGAALPRPARSHRRLRAVRHLGQPAAAGGGQPALTAVALASSN